MNDVSANLAPEFPSEDGDMSVTPLPLLPSGKGHLWCRFFALLAINGPFSAELKFRENTVFAGYFYLYKWVEVRNKYIQT